MKLFYHAIACLAIALLAAIALTAPPAYASNYGGGGSIGGGGAPVGLGTISGNGQVRVLDIHNMHVGARWPNRVTNVCPDYPNYFNSMTGYPINSNNLEGSHFGVCARRLAVNALRFAPQNVTANQLRGVCNESRYTGVNQNICLVNRNLHFGTFREVHHRTDVQESQLNRVGATNTTTLGTPVAINFRVWRYNARTGNGSATPVFQRSIALGANYSDDGRLSDQARQRCASNTGAYQIAVNNCISHPEWWYGGDGRGQSSGWWRGSGAHRGPLMGKLTRNHSVDANRESACRSHWSTLRGEMARLPWDWANRGANGRRVVHASRMPNNRTGLARYILQNGSYNPSPGVTACIWGFGNASHRWFVYPNNGSTRHPVRAADAPSYRESFAVLWRVNSGPRAEGRSDLFFRIQGVPGAVYIVQWNLISREEHILGSQMFSFFSSVGESTPTAPPPVTPTPSPGDDPSDHIDPGSPFSIVGVDAIASGAYTMEFPQLTTSMQVPSESATGKISDWIMTARPLHLLDQMQALWPVSSSFNAVEPQAADNGWSGVNDGYNMGSSPILRARETGRTPNVQHPIMTGSWPIDAFAGTQQRTMLSINNAPTFNPQEGYPDILWSGQYETTSLVPSRSQTRPMLGVGNMAYESGRFFDSRRTPTPGFRTDQIRAFDEYAAPQNVASGEEASVGASFYYQGKCSIGSKPSVTPCARVSVSVNNPSAVERVEITPRSAPDSVLRVIQGSGLSFSSNGSFPSGIARQTAHVDFVSDSDLDIEGYNIRLVFHRNAVNSQDIRWALSSSQWGDMNDRWEWAGVSTDSNGNALGPDHDPWFNVTRPGGTEACSGGSCGSRTDHAKTVILGNQPSQ